MRRHCIPILISMLIAGCAVDEVAAISDPAALSAKWRSCPPEDQFSKMKSGDTCAFENDCREAYDDSGYWWAWCYHNVLYVMERKAALDPEPRADAYWTDCPAAADARNGEACWGMFGCLREASDACVEKTVCSWSHGETVGSIRHFYLCDVPNESTAPGGTAHTDCTDAWDALPGDGCESSFLCGMSTAVVDGEVVFLPPDVIPLCDAQDAYCPAERDYERIVWCRDGRITVVYENL